MATKGEWARDLYFRGIAALQLYLGYIVMKSLWPTLPFVRSKQKPVEVEGEWEGEGEGGGEEESD